MTGRFAALRCAGMLCLPVLRVLLPLIVFLLALSSSPDLARADATCTVNFGTVPYGSTDNIHDMLGGTPEQIACDPRYPAPDSGVAPPISGASNGGGTWSGTTETTYNRLKYTPHVRWVGPDTYTMYFCNAVNCPGDNRVIATVNVTVAAPTIALTASLPNGTVATAYSQVLTASGSASPYGFSVDRKSVV